MQAFTYQVGERDGLYSCQSKAENAMKDKEVKLSRFCSSQNWSSLKYPPSSQSICSFNMINKQMSEAVSITSKNSFFHYVLSIILPHKLAKQAKLIAS